MPLHHTGIMRILKETESSHITNAGCFHEWIAESRHVTSEGWIAYTRCVRCAARRVESYS